MASGKKLIHAFSEDGELSDGAALALAPYATKTYVADAVDGITGGGGAWQGALEAHIESDTPHPKYDDIQSLSLLFKNRLV